jgi:hypothetical protein
MVKSLEKILEQRKAEQERYANTPRRGKYVHTAEQAEKIKATQLRRVAERVNNRAIQKECIHCGLVAQQYMIDRWHNENCAKYKDEQSRIWLYVSPKLRGLKVR